MLENIKNDIYVRLEMLFAELAADELTGDMEGYQQKLITTSVIAKALGINTIISYVYCIFADR